MKNIPKVSCLVITLCKSPNFGAYLQAFALKEVLENYGYKVSFLDIYDEDNERKRYKFLFLGWKRRPLSIIFNIKKLFAFRDAEKLLDIIPRGNLSGFKAAFIGSDEIWSVKNGSFISVPEFFGLNLGGMLTFSYAPSVGDSGVEDMDRYREYSKGLEKLNMLSVRDIETFDVATKVARRKDVELVLDPTFLYDFTSREKVFELGCNYMLVYTYGFPDKVVAEIKAYAKKHSLTIVSAGFYHSWADRNIPCTPFEFLSIIKSATCVVTDTFHGSIFALKYRKNFVSYGRNKKKVRYLLESLGLSDSLVDAGHLDGRRLIETNYSNLDNKLQPLIDQSHAYLQRCDDMVRR